MPLIREVPFAVFVAKFVASEQGTGFVNGLHHRSDNIFFAFDSASALAGVLGKISDLGHLISETEPVRLLLAVFSFLIVYVGWMCSLDCCIPLTDWDDWLRCSNRAIYRYGCLVHLPWSLAAPLPLELC
jgi:hypothetical protein